MVVRTGKVRQTVKRALEKLIRHGLLAGDEGTWSAVVPADRAYNQIAEKCGTLGKTADRIARNKDKREQYASAEIQKQKDLWTRRRSYNESRT
jgi:hypothetical protein